MKKRLEKERGSELTRQCWDDRKIKGRESKIRMGGRKEFFEGRGENLEMERKREEGEIEMRELIKREKEIKREEMKKNRGI